MDNTTYELGPLLAEVRDGFRGMRAIRTSKRLAARAARARRKSLERELDSYTSPRDLHDLEALLARHSEQEAAEIRAILTRRAA